MKVGTLRAIAHNIADSLGSGIGMLIGIYDMDIFGEARKNSQKSIRVDFLAGKVTGGVVSTSLATAIEKYRRALPALCTKHGASMEDFKTLSARYSIDRLEKRIRVTVRDRDGRCYVDEYVGTPARHIKVTDHLGRARTKRGKLRQLRVVARRPPA